MPPALTPRLRKFTLTAHIACSVGWLGAVIAYLALVIAWFSSHDPQMVWAAALSMDLIGWYVLIPCSLATLLTGLIQSMGTRWGLFRHYWILTKFVLTIGAATVLLLHVPAISRMAAMAATAADPAAVRHPTFIVHAAAGLAVLLTITTLSVYKPWGRTPFGQRLHGRPTSSSPTSPAGALSAATVPDRLHRTSEDGGTAGTPRAGLYILLGTTVLILLMLALHLAKGGSPLGSH
jgi:hypothetical protein